MDVLTKTCSSCQADKPVSLFYRNHGNQCKPCLNSQVKSWTRRNGDRRKAIAKRHYEKRAKYTKRAWVLKRYFGMTVEVYESLLSEQKGVCAICSRAEVGKKLCVDHNHKTGKVRGLLCALCNQSIGMLQEDVNVLQKAIEYLRIHSV